MHDYHWSRHHLSDLVIQAKCIIHACVRNINLELQSIYQVMMGKCEQKDAELRQNCIEHSIIQWRTRIVSLAKH